MKFGTPTNVKHLWFAWYPVKTLDGEDLWLETVYRTFRYNTWPRSPYYERRAPTRGCSE